MPLKGNDMELFHFLSAGPQVINYAPGMLRKNLKNILTLILVHQFTPFPPRPKLQLDNPHIHQQPTPEEYPPKDGYENDRQLNDVNGARSLLILFPPTPASDWNCPTVSIVISRLNELINLAFNLSISLLSTIEHRLDEIGDIFGMNLQSFRKNQWNLLLS
ncbi:15326_t:CDS:2 [Funneliformis mosseae]|uniref:15326_t:CDS:1 n=1 Tax=Funneliformis mosseae TaxID=27381 RepID=A0A9N9G260_FUNMO|nr:15326_t:CDS:2 [Funneliformis mosseae]